MIIGMLLRKIKGSWRVALLLSSVLKLPLTTDNHDQQVNERADLCIAVEKAIGNLGSYGSYVLQLFHCIS